LVVGHPAPRLDFVCQAALAAQARDRPPVRSPPDKPHARGITAELTKRPQQDVEPFRALESTEEQGWAGVSIRGGLPRVAEELRRRAVVHGMDAIRRKPIGSSDEIATVAARWRAHIGSAQSDTQRGIRSVTREPSEPTGQWAR